MTQTQPEFVNLVGQQIGDRKIDELVFETNSYNEKYSQLMVREGINPIVPEGYELLEKQVDLKTGITTITIARLASVSHKPGIIPIETPPELPPVGIGADLAVLKDIKESENIVLRNATAQPQFDPSATVNELDELRQTAKQYSILPTYAPHLVATRSFTPNRVVEENSMMLMVMLIVVVILIAIYVKRNSIKKSAIGKFIDDAKDKLESWFVKLRK